MATAIRAEKKIFAISTAGAVVVAVLTVASAWAVGIVVADVIVPGLQRGRVDTVALSAAVIVLVGLSEVKMVGIFARRLGSAYFQLRMQARYRRRPTRPHLELP